MKMKIFKYFNSGPYGSFEEGLLINVGGARLMLTEFGLKEAPSQYIFRTLIEVSGEDFNKEVLSFLGNLIAGSKEMTENLLFVMNPDTVAQFVEDNIKEK